MAHKPDVTLSLSSPIFPPSSRLSPSDKLLSFILPLPPNPSIVYATYSPCGAAPPCEVLESARRHLVSRNQSCSFQDSILPHVHIDRDASLFHAFIVASGEQVDTSFSTLKDLAFDDLIVLETSSFTPRGLYPCSSACADNHTPCPSCLAPQVSSFISAACLLPRKPLRQIYIRFIHAVRTYLIDHIVTASLASAVRLDNGFLLIPKVASNEWGADWDHHAQLRPLVHCHLDLHLAHNRIEVHTLFRMPPCTSLPTQSPLPPGTPLTILPTGVPAFFLAHYTGPTASLTAHFISTLAPHPLPQPKDTQYIIAWLAVQNKQGEDKGTPIIWPTALCLVSTSSTCKSLEHIPELPAQLQPSPPPPPSFNVGRLSAEAPNTPLRVLTNHPLTRRPAMVSPSPLRVLRTLALTHISLQNIASEVGSYVESVVRERDRERERIRRERETIASTPILPQAAMPTAAIPTSAPDVSDSQHSDSPPQTHVHPSIYYPSPLTAIEPPAHAEPTSAVPEPQVSRETDDVPIPAPFDPFNTMDATWSQPASDYMNYDIGPTAQRRLDMDFVDYDTFTFTDDDFSFFDRPSRPSDTAPVLVPDGLSPNIFGVADVTMPFSPPTGAQLFPDIATLGPTPTPALPSPPGSLSAPSTPHVKVTHALSQVTRTFDPIDFSPSHSLADTKYFAGKFALPSPPDEEDRTSPLPVTCSKRRSTASTTDFHSRYRAATDPRISVVRQLIGVKRKSISLDHGRVRSRQFLPSSYDDSAGADESPSLEDDEKSETASEDDVGIDEEHQRSTTPPPSYLPLGPMLLHTHFHHAMLLPLCQPLRPPGSAVAPMSLALAPPPVAAPTPVSPAASLEKINQELAAAGAALTREAVENPVWARAFSCRRNTEQQIWPSDIQELGNILKQTNFLDGPVELLKMFASDDIPAADGVYLQRLDPPMFSVGKSGCVVQVLPSALRFWEKLGFTPHGGKRDVVAFVFLEEGGLEKQHQAEIWLNKMSVGYTAKQLGSFTAGSSTMCSADGVMPVRLENFRKSIRSFLQCLESKNDLVFYVAIPDSALGFNSPLLREIFSFAKQTQTKHSEVPILFQFIPEHLIALSESPSSEVSEIDALCYATYRRMPKPVERSVAGVFFDDNVGTIAYFQEQPFVLARSPSTVHFTQSTAARSLDVLDRHTFLHVGYRFSACGKWLLATCVDQRGENYDLGTWLIQDEMETSAVVQVWNFALQFAKRANVEWRIVIAKLGPMTVSELEGWNIHLSAAVPLCNDAPPFHVSLLSVEQNLCWPTIPHLNEMAGLVSPRRAPAKDSKSIYVDVAPAYAIYPSTRIPISSRPSQEQVDCPFIPENDGTMNSDTSSILPVFTSILVRCPSNLPTSIQSSIYIHLLHALRAPGSSLLVSDDTMRNDITLNFYELAVYAGAMLGLQQHPLLPFHLAALEVMQDSLRQEDIN